LRTKTRLWITGSGVQKVYRPAFISAGLLLAEERLSGWKLVNGSVQKLSPWIKNGIVMLDKEELKSLFASGSIRRKAANGYYVISFDEKPIASGYMENNRIRVRLPHAFKLIV
jgi:hypothetical protein